MASSKEEDSWACRAPQHAALRALLATPCGRSIFVSGGSSTGKRTIVRRAIGSDAQVVSVDCVVEHTERLLFSAIAGTNVSADAGELLRELRSCNHGGVDTERTVVILYRAERLVSGRAPLSSATLSVLLTLPRLVGRPGLSVVLISRLPWPRFRDIGAPECAPPACVYFPCYTPSQLAAALRSGYERPSAEILGNVSEEDADKLYPDFVRMVADLLSSISTDVRELHNISREMYPRYLAPLREGGMKKKGAHLSLSLFNTVTAELRGVLQHMHRREFVVQSGKLVPKHAAQNGTGMTELQTPNARVLGMKDGWACAADGADAEIRDLSTVARFLLLAAFLASRNPAKHDMRYFTSERTRRPYKKKKQVASVKAATHAFSHERLLAIFEAMRELSGDETALQGENVGSTLSTGGQVQISNLVRLGYLCNDSSGDPLADPKYRAHVPQRLAENIARTVKVELHQYLHVES